MPRPFPPVQLDQKSDYDDSVKSTASVPAEKIAFFPKILAFYLPFSLTVIRDLHSYNRQCFHFY